MSTKKKTFIAVLGAEGVIIILLMTLILYFSSNAVKVNRQMRFAQRYLLEDDYKRAINAFEMIIEMDAQNVEAYIGMAQAYAETGVLEKTVEILEEGAIRVKKSDSDEIQVMLDIYTEELAEKEKLQETALGTADIFHQQDPIEGTVDTNTQSGEVVTVNTGFITQDGEMYYYDELGSPVVGWFEVEGNRYYAGTDGRLYRDGEYEVDSVKYLFGQEGACIEEIKDDAWKQAYIDYLKYMREDYIEFYVNDEDNSEYNLIYIDDDDIPEVAVLLPDAGPRSICGFVYYSNGIADGFDTDGCYGYTYMERKNFISYMAGNLMYDSGASECFSKLEDGQLIDIAEYPVRWNDNGNELVYTVNGIDISEEEFDEVVKKIPYIYDEAIFYSTSYTYEQIIEMIINY